MVWKVIVINVRLEEEKGPGLSPESRCHWSGNIRCTSFQGRYVQTGGNTWFWAIKDDKVCFLFIFWPCPVAHGIFSSPARDWTYVPKLGTWSLNHWTARRSQGRHDFWHYLAEVGGKGSIKRRSISIRGSRVKYHPYSCSTAMRHQAGILSSSFVKLRK